MSVDYNFQLGFDFFLVVLVIDQIFFGNSQNARHSSSEHRAQHYLKCDVLCDVNFLIRMRRY
jgi:hypothetical protein